MPQSATKTVTETPEASLAGTVRSCRSMAEVRAEIDRLDRRIIALLGERSGYVHQAAHIKGARAEIVDAARIEDVIAKVRQRAGGAGLAPDLAEAVYRLMIERFIALEAEEFDRLHGQAQDGQTQDSQTQDD